MVCCCTLRWQRKMCLAIYHLLIMKMLAFLLLQFCDATKKAFAHADKALQIKQFHKHSRHN